MIHPIRILLTLTLALLLSSIGIAKARTFTDDKGRSIEAELLKVEGTDVTFKTGGREFTLPITRFSEPDQAFIQKWGAEKKAGGSFNLGIYSGNTKPATATPGSPKPDTPGQPPVAAADAPKPGATLSFTFPELENDFGGKPAGFSARIPKSYDPTKPVPLFIFLGGGKGTGSPGGATSLTRDDFVCVGLPYPNSGRNPRQGNMVGNFDTIWDYWKPMIAKLEEAVPNLDPNFRIIGGFSNGAHAIDGLLKDEDFSSKFAAFILIEGGGGDGRSYRGARDKHIYFAWGEKSPIAAYSRIVLADAKRGGLKMQAHQMTGIGHQFPKSEKTAVRAWLYDTVIPDLSR